jgi:hypothetical protein
MTHRKKRISELDVLSVGLKAFPGAWTSLMKD